MVRALGKLAEHIEQCLSAPLRDVDVRFDETLIMRLVGKATTDERDIVLVESPLSVLRHAHHLPMVATFGSANSILVTPDGITGGADPRQRGTLADGY